MDIPAAPVSSPPVARTPTRRPTAWPLSTESPRWLKTACPSDPLKPVENKRPQRDKVAGLTGDSHASADRRPRAFPRRAHAHDRTRHARRADGAVRRRLLQGLVLACIGARSGADRVGLRALSGTRVHAGVGSAVDAIANYPHLDVVLVRSARRHLRARRKDQRPA